MPPQALGTEELGRLVSRAGAQEKEEKRTRWPWPRATLAPEGRLTSHPWEKRADNCDSILETSPPTATFPDKGQYFYSQIYNPYLFKNATFIDCKQ